MRLSQLPDALADRFGPTNSAFPDRHRKNAAVALVLRPPSGVADPRVDRCEVLAIRRADSSRDPWSGQMALPGGSLDAVDPGLMAAAVREAHEETGLRLDVDGHPLGRIEPMRPLGVRLPVITIWPFVFQADPTTKARIASPEVASVHWFQVRALGDRSNRDSYTYRDPSLGARQFPCIRLDGQVIWGLTYRILTQFLEVLRSSA
ncbi:MAG: CoA pyrophosphatase [Gemmatimonadetes bacterium]|nr:CoA pyrophosphatase [Gemmatimonadota bacterium]